MLSHIVDYLATNSMSDDSFSLRLHSPGRINIIGEHTDYTGGWVMPAAIDKGIEFYARRIEGSSLILHAVDLDKSQQLPLPVTGKTGELWVDYLAGIVEQFQQLGHEIPGLEIVFGGNVPRGSGMSSSAALEGGMAFLLNEVLAAGLSRPELARLSQRSSNEFIGVPTGIMDQFASLNGSPDGPILLNCDSLDFQPISADLPGYRWLLVNSMVTHELGSSEYPVRVAECQEALEALQKIFPDLAKLSHASQDQLEAVIDDLRPIVRKRASYVVGENIRVRQMAQALKAGDVNTVGKLLNKTHQGLRDDFQVSCEEVDLLQFLASENFRGAVAGSRIMGGGFGGCTINLVKAREVNFLKAFLKRSYREAYDKTPEFYEVNIGPGTRLI
ncbi:galactokinase [Neolewinella agarilytica]|uniref:Galactokinase n=1 Tax=Neolewinella agarilytica TaxID=478744 RepID=A0A1H8ZH21_9BACT|nr:galactokinase [Neolewinella agarilytica]SEP63710.1 galactokinase [Neolewinella agarilytica]